MKKRIPRKEIAMKFKAGASIEDLAWQYRGFFKVKYYTDRFGLITDIIRQHMRKQSHD
jgi:hypothetical protein